MLIEAGQTERPIEKGFPMTEENNAPQPQPAPQPVPEPQPASQPQPAPQPQPMPQAVPQPQPQQPYGQPYQQPVYAPAPLMQLTGGMKFGWLVIGALMGIPGIVLAWLVNADKAPQVKSDALKFAIIGFVIWIVLGILLSLAITGMVTAVVAGAMGTVGGGYHYGSSW